jgi:site-specific DNA-methyltransferase (adenine-specific)
MKKEVKQSWFKAKSHEYETPDSIFVPLNREFRFTLDVAANNLNAKCESFYSKDDDGLSQDWGINVCWMNPPFGRVMKSWVKKAYESALNGATVVCLLPVRSNTVWWHEYCMRAAEIRLIRGEVKFKGHSNGLWLPLAIVVFHNKSFKPTIKSMAA